MARNSDINLNKEKRSFATDDAYVIPSLSKGNYAFVSASPNPIQKIRVTKDRHSEKGIRWNLCHHAASQFSYTFAHEWQMGGVASLVPMEGGRVMHILSEEQRQLVELLSKDERISIVYSFYDNEVPVIWVIVKNEGIETELEITGYYVDIAKKFPHFICDFIVFNEQELICLHIPKDATILYSDFKEA